MEMILLLVSWLAIILCSTFLRFFCFCGLVNEHEEQSPTASGGAPQMLASAYKGALEVRTYQHYFKVLLTSNLYHYVHTNPRLL